MAFEGIEQEVVDTLTDIQEKIYAKALAFRTENTHVVNTWDEFNAKLAMDCILETTERQQAGIIATALGHSGLFNDFQWLEL
jgi:hypothetical protein